MLLEVTASPGWRISRVGDDLEREGGFGLILAWNPSMQFGFDHISALLFYVYFV